jgi:hypothetical protein
MGVIPKDSVREALHASGYAWCGELGGDAQAASIARTKPTVLLRSQKESMQPTFNTLTLLFYEAFW